MRNFFTQLRFLLKDTWQSRGARVPVESSLARTAKDATTIGENRGSVGSFTGAVSDVVAQSHENYAKSFEKRERPR